MATVSIRKKDSNVRTLLDGHEASFVKLSSDGSRAAVSIPLRDGGMIVVGMSCAEFNAVIESYQRACNATTKG